MTGWQVLLITLIGAALGGIGYRLGEETVFPKLRDMFRLRFGRTKTFADFFDGRGTLISDVCLFSATTRRHLPLTDILYFEYLRHLLRTERVRKVILGRWHPLEGEDLFRNASHGWQEYDIYVDSLFHEFGHRVVRLNGREILERDNALPPLFWRALKDIGARKHLTWAPSIGLSVRRLGRLTKQKPGDRLSGVVGHAINNVELAPTVLRELRLAAAARPEVDPVLSILFWEVELDRLAVFHELHSHCGSTSADEVPIFELNPIAGRTILGRFGRISNNHSPESAISFGGSGSGLVAAIQRQSRREVRGYRIAVAAILSELYAHSTPRSKWASHGEAVLRNRMVTDQEGRSRRLSTARLELLYLVTRLREEHRKLRSETEVGIA